MGILNTMAAIVLPKSAPIQWTNSRMGEANFDLIDENRDPYSVATALRCMSLIASAVAGCPIRATDAHTGDVVAIPGLQYVAGNPTPFAVIETSVLHLAGWGNAFLRKQRGKDGAIYGLGPIHPSTVQVEYNSKARKSGLPLDKRFVLSSGETLTSEDILHIAGPSDDGVLGLSIIEKAKRVFAAARETDKTAEKLGRQGMRIPGILATEQQLDSDKAEAVQKRWEDKTSGSSNAGRVPVLGSGLTFKPLDMNPADAQFLEQRRYSVTEIARLYGIPGWMVNDQEKSTSWGTGQQQQFISFITITLKPYMQRIERQITAELLDHERIRAEFKVEGLLRGDSAARAAFYASGVQHGWLVPNDIRPLEDLPRVPWGDEPYLPYNQSAAAQTKGPTDDGTD